MASGGTTIYNTIVDAAHSGGEATPRQTEAIEGSEMQTVVVLVNEPPSSMRAWNGLRLVAALIGADTRPELFLLNDGVFCAIRGQETPDELAGQNTSRKITELMELGAAVKLCTQCAKTRGLTPEGLIDGIEWVSMVDLAKAIRDSDKVVSF